MLSQLLLQPADETNRVSSPLSGLPSSCLEAGIHARKNLIARNHLYCAGVNLVEAALDLVAPCGFDFGGDLLIFDEEAFRQPLLLVWWELPSFFEESLGVWTHGEIVARIRCIGVKPDFSITARL